MKISTLLDQIDMGSVALPEFQRGYVWNRDQVRRLMASLYRRHPVGSLLVWVTLTENADARGDSALEFRNSGDTIPITQICHNWVCFALRRPSGRRHRQRQTVPPRSRRRGADERTLPQGRPVRRGGRGL